MAVDKGTVREPMAVQRVPAALWLFHPWGAWVWGCPGLGCPSGGTTRCHHTASEAAQQAQNTTFWEEPVWDFSLLF